MIDELQSGIFDYGVANVAGLTSANFHHGEAPPAMDYPHVVFHGDASPFEWDSAIQIENAGVNFMVYGATQAQVKTLAAAISTAFDFDVEKTIDCSPYGVREVSRIQTVPARQVGDTWVINLIYVFIIEKARS